MSKQRIAIIIPRDGAASRVHNLRAIYTPDAVKILSKIGKISTTRASHVEPGLSLSAVAIKILADDPATAHIVTAAGAVCDEFSNHWFADMSPTGMNVVLGPYQPEDRDKALADEVSWLLQHNIPVADPLKLKEQNG